MKTTIHPRFAAEAGIRISSSGRRDHWFPTPSGPIAGTLHWCEIHPVPEHCQFQLGRLLARIPDISGNITVRCLTKNERDKSINGKHPGTPEHDELLRMWSIPDRPAQCRVRLMASYQPNNETPEQYCDRLALQICGPAWINEIFQIRAAGEVQWNEADAHLAETILSQ